MVTLASTTETQQQRCRIILETELQFPFGTDILRTTLTFPFRGRSVWMHLCTIDKDTSVIINDLIMWYRSHHHHHHHCHHHVLWCVYTSRPILIPILIPTPMKMVSMIMCRTVSTELVLTPMHEPIPIPMATAPNLVPIRWNLTNFYWYHHQYRSQWSLSTFYRNRGRNLCRNQCQAV